MNILVINSGSSSIKCKYFVNNLAISSLTVESIGSSTGGKFTLETKEAKTHPIKDATSHKAVLHSLFEILLEAKIINSTEEIDAIGHRVVHGGSLFSEPTLITTDVIEKIRTITPLAPLHNPANLDGIEIIQKSNPNLLQVAVFDTAFHQTMPEKSYLYALPYTLYETDKIRRYGFHGTSHSFVAKRAAKLLHKELSQLNLITLHLGNGASVTAIKNGKSYHTSMGFTPLEGLIMGSRSGDIDPAIVLYLQRELQYSIEEIDTLLNKKSGLLGICGNNDMRQIIEKSKSGDQMSQLALDMYVAKVLQYIGAYHIMLGNIDAIVFTGGIGEHAAIVREMICNTLSNPLNIKLDTKNNESNISTERVITKSDSKFPIFVIPTNEELEIAIQTEEIIAQIDTIHN